MWKPIHNGTWRLSNIGWEWRAEVFTRTVRGVDYHVYENKKEFRKDYPKALLVNDWRNGKPGDWIVTDDNQVTQIVDRVEMYNTGRKIKNDVVKTLLGMAWVRSDGKLGGKPASSISSFTKRSPNESRARRNAPTHQERIFAEHVSAGVSPVEAYFTAFSTNDPTYADRASRTLLATKRVQNLVRKEIEEKAHALGIIQQKGVRDSDKLRALETLAKATGVLDTTKSTETVALLHQVQDFTREQLESWQEVQPDTKKLADGKKEK